MIDNPCEGRPVADNSSREPRMIGDFDGSANALWSLYGKEAKSHDGVRIHTLKEDMGDVVLFVRPYFVHAYNGLGHADAWFYRPVYFPLLSHRSSLIANRTCKLTPQIKWCITSDNIPPSFLRSPNKSLPLPHRFPFPLLRLSPSPLSTHQHPMSA